MKAYFLKNNVFHPVLTIDSKTIVWERIEMARGLLATEHKGTIDLLRAIAGKHPNQVREIKEDEYLGAKKKSSPRRATGVTYVQNQARQVERSLTPRKSSKESPKPLVNAVGHDVEGASRSNEPESPKPGLVGAVQRGPSPRRKTTAIESPVISENPPTKDEEPPV